jgi:hypothetical protein
VFLAALGADEMQIEASFCEAIRIAKEQKSTSLEERAEVTTQNISGKKRALQEDVVSDYLFDNFLQRIRQTNPSSRAGVFLMQCRDDRAEGVSVGKRRSRRESTNWWSNSNPVDCDRANFAVNTV